MCVCACPILTHPHPNQISSNTNSAIKKNTKSGEEIEGEKGNNQNQRYNNKYDRTATKFDRSVFWNRRVNNILYSHYH